MNGLNLTCQISKNENVVFTQLDEDMVMMGPEDGQYYGINSVGTEIWGLLNAGETSVQTICDYILNKYEVEEAQCVAEVTQFIESMVTRKMIKVSK